MTKSVSQTRCFQCQGGTNCYEPPTIAKMRGRFTDITPYLIPYRSHASDWGMISQQAGTCSSIINAPGYYAGVNLERIGMKILYNTKKAKLMANLMVYEQIARRLHRDEALDRFLVCCIPQDAWLRDIAGAGEGTIALTLKLIAGSSDLEFTCTTVCPLNTVTILTRLLSHFDAMRGSIKDSFLLEYHDRLDLTARSFLCVVATPFTGVSVASNSNVVSVLKNYGWPREGSGRSIRHYF
jgi:hypothetical protein